LPRQIDLLDGRIVGDTVREVSPAPGTPHVPSPAAPGEVPPPDGEVPPPDGGDPAPWR
jgi:hypothetical protein